MLLMNNKKVQEYFVAPKPGFENAIKFCKRAPKGANKNLCRKCAPGPNFDDFKRIIGYKLSSVDFDKILKSIKMNNKQGSTINEQQRKAINERLKEKFVRPLQTELMNNFNAIEQDIYGRQMDWWKTGKNKQLC
jgi:hypothetical protein